MLLHSAALRRSTFLPRPVPPHPPLAVVVRDGFSFNGFGASCGPAARSQPSRVQDRVGGNLPVVTFAVTRQWETVESSRNQ